MEKYKRLEIIRDWESLDVLGATLYCENTETGEKVRYEIKGEYEVDRIQMELERQKHMTREELIAYGYLAELTNREIKSGDYKGESFSNYGVPDLKYFERNRRSDKYNGEIKWVDREPVKNGKSRSLNFSDNSKLNIRPLLLTLLIAGTIGIGGYTTKNVINYKNHVQTTNYNDFGLFFNYSGINEVMQKIATGRQDEVSSEEMDNFIQKINEMYQSNLSAFRGEYPEGRPRYSGMELTFSTYYSVGSKNREVLEYLEDRYNRYVERYTQTLEYGEEDTTRQLLVAFCDELYNFVLKNENLMNGGVVKYSDLSSITKLIILEMFENCTNSSNYEKLEHYKITQYKSGVQKFNNDQIIEQINGEKNRVKNDLYKLIGVYNRNSK